MSQKGESPSVVPAKRRARLAVALVLVVLLLPTVANGLFHGPRPASLDENPGTSVGDTANVTVIATQGDELSSGGDSRLLVVERESGETLQEWTRHTTYYDVDVLNETTLLYIGVVANGSTYAYERNWRTGEVYRSFDLPDGSHDVDSLGSDRYVFVNGSGDRAVVYDYENDSVVWEYDFSEHYPPSAGGGPPDSYAGDYTHLNDVDLVANGTKFLLSPRNFDRVVLVNRSTKETEWTLGEEDDHTVLYEQHNPDLIRTDPPTVLVADSENDRVVEYRRLPNGEWRLIWEYSGDLVWPRDADRLANGNTLIVDSRKIVEVTPSRDVVWEMKVPKYLYDSERLGEGDSQRGPSMVENRDRFDTPRDTSPAGGIGAALVEPIDGLYNTAGWVLPWWLGKGSFVLLLPAVGLLVAWGNVELRDALSRRAGTVAPRDRLLDRLAPLPSVMLLLAGTAVLGMSTLAGVRVGDSLTDVTIAWWYWDPAFHAVGLLLLLEGVNLLPTTSRAFPAEYVAYARQFLVAVIVVLAVALVFLATVYDGAHHVSNPHRLLAFSSVGLLALIEWVRRPASLDRSVPGTTNRRPRRTYVQGSILAVTSLAVLGVGLDATILPESYVLLALVLLSTGDGMLAAATHRTANGPVVGTVAVLSRYLVRPVWLGLAAGIVLQVLGLGAIAGVGTEVTPFHPVVLGLALLCLTRLLRRPADR